MKLKIAILLMVFAVGLIYEQPSSADKTPSVLRLPDSPAMTRWVDSVMATLSERDRVAQLFVPRLDIFDNESGRAQLDKMVGKEHVGGILLGKGTIDGYASLINYAQTVSQVPLMVTLDGEWGLSMRVEDAPRFPYNMGLGAVSDPQALYEYGREVARECRQMGIHVNFAPVLDVNSNPSNPVIGYRSFGEDPERVAALGTAYSKGLEAGGVMAVGKHFPGHGDTSADSHKELPTVNHSAELMQQVDLLPFKTFIDAGLSGIMVGHLNVPALDPSGKPASLSYEITTGLLRNRMGFDGLIFTDALAMKGAVSGNENNCVSALRAGADVLLGSASPRTDIDAVLAAVRQGRLSQADIDARCRKMLSAKYALGLASYKPDVVSGLKQRINSTEADAVTDRLAEASITVVYNKNNLLPISGLGVRKILVVNIGSDADNLFSEYCGKYARVDARSVKSAEVPAALLADVRNADIVIVGVYSDAQWARSAYAKVAAATSNLVPVFFVNPYKMGKFGPSVGQSHTLVAAYDDTPALRKYAAQALFGGIKVDGRFPVNVKNVAPIGTGVVLGKNRLGFVSATNAGFSPRIYASIDSVVSAAIEAKAFPGCQVLVAKGGDVVVDASFGNFDYSPGSPRIDADAIYDIASMTKATATISGIMKAYDEGLFDIDDKISSHIPELKGTDKEAITVRQLLVHESGFPASLPMYRIMVDEESFTPPLTKRRPGGEYTLKIDNNMYGNRNARLRPDITAAKESADFDVEVAKGIYVGTAAYDTVMHRIYDVPLLSKRYRYSCLNFCLLMNMVENLTGVSMDQWVDTEVFAPLGAYHTGYRPLTYWQAEKIVPTENDGFLRRQMLKGYVHDEIAAFSGGVQGNAGLFANALDIAKLCQMWLNGGEYGGERILKQGTVDKFLHTYSASGERGLGFDMAKRLQSMADIGLPPATFGHTGFTGTCFWVDPDNELIYVFLSNRVHPSRHNAAFSELSPRTAVLNEVYKALK